MTRITQVFHTRRGCLRSTAYRTALSRIFLDQSRTCSTQSLSRCISFSPFQSPFIYHQIPARHDVDHIPLARIHLLTILFSQNNSQFRNHITSAYIVDNRMIPCPRRYPYPPPFRSSFQKKRALITLASAYLHPFGQSIQP